MKIIRIQYVSEWDECSVIETAAELDLDTGVVEPDTSNNNPEGTLTREYIMFKGEEFNVSVSDEDNQYRVSMEDVARIRTLYMPGPRL